MEGGKIATTALVTIVPCGTTLRHVPMKVAASERTTTADVRGGAAAAGRAGSSPPTARRSRRTAATSRGAARPSTRRCRRCRRRARTTIHSSRTPPIRMTICTSRKGSDLSARDLAVGSEDDRCRPTRSTRRARGARPPWRSRSRGAPSPPRTAGSTRSRTRLRSTPRWPRRRRKPPRFEPDSPTRRTTFRVVPRRRSGTRVSITFWTTRRTRVPRTTHPARSPPRGLSRRCITTRGVSRRGGSSDDACSGPVRGARTAKALRAADAILGRHERNDGYGRGSAEGYSRVYHHR